MRKFSSYGSLNTKLHYYAPREALIEQAVHQLTGQDPDSGGHYITIWGPRQAGKTWLMLQAVERIKAQDDFQVAILTMQSAKEATTDQDVLGVLVSNLKKRFDYDFPPIDEWKELNDLFSAKYFTRPLILILDEFDSIDEPFITKFANELRVMYTDRLNEADKKSSEKSCLLHGLALVGVRAVLGIENVRGSPFNVQRSFRVPNLSLEQVDGMFKWYERESGQAVEQKVIERLFYETQGQPGLVGWLGELLTEGDFNRHDSSITQRDFEIVYAAAIKILPNNNILNIISKSKPEPYRAKLLELFRTSAKIPFSYDEREWNFLYMNGVIDWEKENNLEYYVKFSSPFVQKRLFNYLANDIFDMVGQLYAPFDDLSDAITGKGLNVKNLLRRYETYLQKNRHWLLKNAPRRSDLRIYEAVYHFNLYMYISHFLASYDGIVYPEFPTGNGQIDLVIEHGGQVYGLELKSYTNRPEYTKALAQAARYGKQLGLSEITLAFFVEYIDEANRQKYEVNYQDAESGVTVIPAFVEIGTSD